MAQSSDYSKALFIFLSVHWGLYTMEFRKLRLDGNAYKQGDIITSDEADTMTDDKTTAKSLQRIVTMCEAVTPGNIYNRVGKGSYRNQKVFFEKADDKVQRHVKTITGKRISEAVELAASLSIPIFFKPGPREFIDPNKQLIYNDVATPLHTFYRKTDDGLDYKLTIGNGLQPSSHRTVILSNNPSLFCIDNHLLHFGEGLNGNLLRPFIKSEWVHIPKRMENEYLRKMILKIASKIDISAEGFDVVEQYPDGHGVLSLERTIAGEYHYSLSFEYNGKTFAEKSTREKSVTLHDDGDEVRFVCINRNRQWEKEARRRLDEELHLPHQGSLSALLDWTKANTEALNGMGITVEQLTARKYYIGDVRITHDETRRGDWFQMHIRLNFDNGMSVPLTAMRKELTNGEKQFLLPNGEWFVIPDEWLARYSPLMMFGRRNREGGVSVHRSQDKILEHLDLSVKPDERKQPADYSLPQGLNATLRKYQEDGYRWLLGHYYAATGCCLSDDMGLGKTIQSIALILKYKEIASKAASVSQSSEKKPNGIEQSLFSDEEMGGTGSSAVSPVLVAAPASVVHNWRNEIRKFAPSLKELVYAGSIADREKMRKHLNDYDVIVSTYATMRNDIDELAKVEWGLAIFDESQVFKNSESQIYDATKRIACPCRTALSGTPMENNLRELWSLMSILNPSLLGDADDFRRNFINPISENIKSKNTEILRQLVAPYFLRRTKAEVLDSLPDRQDEIVYCEMTPEQTTLYAEVQSRMRNMLLQDKDKINTISALTTITRLRQIACAPAMIGNDSPSGKLAEVYERLSELRGTDHKVLIFSEYVSLLGIVADELKRRGWDYAMLTGETRDREKVIDHFQQEPGCQFFLISLKAGGLGLNLTEADYVFLLDPWWNVTLEEQAISRAHRQGQRRSVFVYRFISSGTLEEEILRIQDRKQSLINAVLSCLNK